MKLAQYNAHLDSTMDADGMVLQYQGISSNSDEYTPMCFQVLWS